MGSLKMVMWWHDHPHLAPEDSRVWWCHDWEVTWDSHVPCLLNFLPFFPSSENRIWEHCSTNSLIGHHHECGAIHQQVSFSKDLLRLVPKMYWKFGIWSIKWLHGEFFSHGEWKWWLQLVTGAHRGENLNWFDGVKNGQEDRKRWLGGKFRIHEISFI